MANKSGNSGCLTAFGLIMLVFAIGAFSDRQSGTGFFLLLVGIVSIVSAVGNSGPASTATPQLTTQAHLRPTPTEKLVPPIWNGLQLKVSTKIEIIDGLSMEILQFYTKGVFSAERYISLPCFEVRITDVTDGGYSGGQILCIIDELQDDSSTVFRLQQKLPIGLSAGAGSNDWVQFGSVPKDALIFPNSGNRKIKVVLRVIDGASMLMVTSADTVWNTLVEGAGYLDSEEDETIAQGAILQLAMCIAAADGTVGDDEVEVIKAWGERVVKALPDTRQAERRDKLNGALGIATKEIRASRVTQLEAIAIETLRNIDEPRMLYDAYEICLHVLKANGEAHPEEMAQLTRIAKKLGLDETKVRILTDRHLADVEFLAGANESEDDHYLGITGGMSKNEIRKHLNKLFDKHQARTTHDKPEVRNRAKEWLERIATARVRHLG